MPLPDEYRQQVVGEWYGSKEVVLTVKQGGRLALFDLGGVGDTGRVAVVSADTPPSKAVQIAAPDLAPSRVLRFRIHDLYHLQLAAGFVYSHTRDDRFQVFDQTVTVDGKDQHQKFIGQTRSRDYNLLSTVELLVHPWAQDYFPWKPRFPGERRPPFYRNVAPLIGFSMTSPNRDFLLGVGWFPGQTAMGVQVGWHFALRDEPPDGTLPNTPLTDPVVVLRQKVHGGPFVGLAFSTQLFRDVFGFVFKQ
jgi:hypothetical protein